MSWRSTTITGEGRGTRRNIEVLVGAVVAVAIVGWALAEFGRQQTGTGPNGSGFVTDVNGTAALVELLDELGHQTVLATAPLVALDDGGTLFVLEPGTDEYLDAEIDEIERWVEAGGRLVVSGRPHPAMTGPILPEDLRLGFRGTSPTPVVAAVRGVDGDIETDGIRSVLTDEPFTTLAGDPPVAVLFERGEGEIVYVADGSVFHNARIEVNAPWVVSVVAEGPARFDELRHGFAAAPASENPTSLLASLPERIRSTVLLLLPVLGLALIVYGRRFGPPEARERELAPPRRELVDAMAGLMTRMPEVSEAAGPVLARLRSTVAQRSGLPTGSPDEHLIANAERIGIDPERLRAALAADDEEGLIAAQRLLAALSERELT